MGAIKSKFMKNSNKYIQLLEYGRDNLSGLTLEQMETKLKELGLPYQYGLMGSTYNPFTQDIFYNYSGKFILTFEGLFELIEHERLEEARKESRKATWVAIISMALTFLALIVSIIQSLCS